MFRRQSETERGCAPARLATGSATKVSSRVGGVLGISNRSNMRRLALNDLMQAVPYGHLKVYRHRRHSGVLAASLEATLTEIIIAAAAIDPIAMPGA